jgi:hypothetical protein
VQGLDFAASVANMALSALVLIGLIARRRLGGAHVFALYLGWGVLARMLTWALPEALYTIKAWIVGEAIQTALMLGVAVELLVLSFGRLPGGWPRARLLLIVGMSLVAAGAVVPPDGVRPEFGELYPVWARLSQVTYLGGLLFAGFLLLAARSGVPTDPLHRAIAVGMMAFATLQVLRPLLVVVDPYIGLGRSGPMKIAYPLILLVWAEAAWRTAAGSLSPEAMRLLQPWRRPA